MNVRLVLPGSTANFVDKLLCGGGSLLIFQQLVAEEASHWGRSTGKCGWLRLDGSPEQCAVGKTHSVFAERVPATEQASRPFYGAYSRTRSSGGPPEQRAVCKTRAVFARAGRACTRC